jgi:putative phosphoribosyl transferase
MKPCLFKDRTDAGRQLARELEQYAGHGGVMVLGLPRGGVPVAFEIAAHLHLPLDVLVVRKLGVPGWPELAMGALASGDVHVFNDAVVRQLGISKEEIAAVIAEESAELHRRETTYRGQPGAPSVEDKTVILVDDGIATGSTMKAAVEAIRQLNPKMIVVAAPVASSNSCEHLEEVVDHLVILHTPTQFRSVGEFYEHFDQTSDDEVTSLLTQGQSFRHPIAHV